MRFWALVVCLMGLLWGRTARAEDAHKAECASAYEKSQEFRTANKLQKAEELLKICAEPSCPTFVQTDCAQWLTEVQKDLPSIVVVAKDKEGADVTAVKVSMDGDVVATELDGKPIVVDPGRHKFRFEMEGAPSVDQPIIIKQGEKEREVRISFRGAETPESAAEPAPYSTPKDEAPPAEEGEKKPSSLRLYSYIAGGVGAAGLISFTVFGLMGKSEQSDLESRGCKPNCPQSDVDSAKSKFVIADISLGVAIVGLGTGVTLFILSQPKSDKASSDESARTHFDMKPLPGGGYASISGQF